MKKYAVLFEDDENFTDQRTRFMPDHLKFLIQHKREVDGAGPIFDAQSSTSAGGLWIVSADNLKQVEQLTKSDPFWPTGLRKSIKILEWTQVFANGKKLI